MDVVLNIPVTVTEEIRALQEKAEIGDVRELFKQALAHYSLLVEEVKNGGTIQVIRTDGKAHKIDLFPIKK